MPLYVTRRRRAVSRLEILIGVGVCAVVVAAVIQLKSMREESLAAAERNPAHLPMAKPIVLPERRAFTDVTATSGIKYKQNEAYLLTKDTAPIYLYQTQTGAAAARDYDGDGWVDLVVSRYDAPPILYHNVSDPKAPGGRGFVDVTRGSGLEINDKINGLCWGDIDNDGKPDLYASAQSGRYYLFINQGNGKFIEHAVERGADVALGPGQEHGGMSVSMGDYDRDGFLDVAVAHWQLPQDHPNSGFQLLHNRGRRAPGYFDVVTHEAKVNTFPKPNLSFTPRFVDLDHDGWPDLAVTSDTTSSRLYWNNHDGTFTDGTEDAAVGTDTSGMGSTLADVDRDGDLDWFVTSIHPQGGDVQGRDDGNRLYLNRLVRTGQAPRPRTFSDATDAAGVRDSGWGWGASFLDYDNDGWPDLIATNGMYVYPLYQHDHTVLWHNETGAKGTLSLRDTGTSEGIVDADYGKGLVVFDYDNDGFPDVFIVNNTSTPILYRNTTNNGAHWLKLQLVGVKSNRDASGAFVRVSDPAIGADLVTEISDSSSYLGQNEPTAFFGLKDFKGQIDAVTIEWPSGWVQTLRHVPVDGFWRITEGSDTLESVAPRSSVIAANQVGG